VRKSFGSDRRAAVEWVEEMRVIRRTGDLPKSAKRAQKPRVQKDEVVTVATLCRAFLAYITSHPEEYRDQKNPPRRIEEIRKAFEGSLAAEITPPEIEEWLVAVQEDRELANGTINKLRGTFSMLYKHGKRKGLTDVNPAEDVPSRTPATVSRGSCRWTRRGVCARSSPETLRRVTRRNTPSCASKRSSG
jgi:hypothetical protein